MLHRALIQLFTDDLPETIDAVAAPLRYVSPHIAEMAHSQVLSDVTTICESLWTVMQEPPGAAEGRVIFTEYLDRRRKIGFSKAELQTLLISSHRTLVSLLKEMLIGDSLDEACAQLNRGFRALESAILEAVEQR